MIFFIISALAVNLPSAIDVMVPVVFPPGPGGAHAWPGVAHAGPTVAHAGPTVAHAGPVVAHAGPGVAGPVVAHAGPVVAHAGPVVAHAGPVVAHARPVVAHPGPGVANAGPAALLPVNILGDGDHGNDVTRPVVYATKSLPPASTDFVSRVWNDFEGTVMPFLGDVAKQAVRTNRDPTDIGVFDSVAIQKEILNGTYSKYQL
jgi:hypothetical protein